MNPLNPMTPYALKLSGFFFLNWSNDREIVSIQYSGVDALIIDSRVGRPEFGRLSVFLSYIVKGKRPDEMRIFVDI